MGTDIHSVAQVRKDGKWLTVLQDVCGDGRNYDTFAMLANVRNGRGFAGVKTGDGFPFIAEPRGLPDDFQRVEPCDDSYDWYGKPFDETKWQISSTSDYHMLPADTPSGDDYAWQDDEAYRKKRLEEKAQAGVVSMGDHSYSWVTALEVNQFIKKWSAESTRKTGVLSQGEYIVWRDVEVPKEPESYCGAVSGKGIETVTAKTYNFLEQSDQLKPATKYYVQVEWDQSIIDSGYIRRISDELNRLCEKHDVRPSYCRMVFGFDS